MDWKDIPSLAALRAFEALARNGSFSAAARELNVSHAAIAQHVRALEAHFATPLAQRDGQAMRLTGEGHDLAESLADGFGTISEGVHRLLDAQAVRPVHVSLTPSFAEAWLMPRLGRFWREHPEVQLQLTPSMELTDLRRDSIDVAIRFGRGDWDGMDVKPLSIGRFVVVAGPDYTEANDLSGLGPLDKHEWFFSSASREQSVWGRSIGVDFSRVGARELPNNGMVLSAVRNGLGLSIQTRTLVEPDLQSGQLISLHEGDPEGLGYYIVTRPGTVPTAGTKAFLVWLMKLSREADLRDQAQA